MVISTYQLTNGMSASPEIDPNATLKLAAQRCTFPEIHHIVQCIPRSH